MSTYAVSHFLGQLKEAAYSTIPPPYFLTSPRKFKPLCKKASRSGTLSARATILCQIAKLAQDWKQRGRSLCLQLIVCTKSMVVLSQPATIHCQAYALKSQDV